MPNSDYTCIRIKWYFFILSIEDFQTTHFLTLCDRSLNEIGIFQAVFIPFKYLNYGHVFNAVFL